MSSAWTAENEAELRRLLRRAYLRDGYRTSTCAGKDSFRSSQMARDAAPRGRGPIAIYLCPLCQRWHVGSHVGPKSRNEPKRIRIRNGVELQQEGE